MQLSDKSMGNENHAYMQMNVKYTFINIMSKKKKALLYANEQIKPQLYAHEWKKQTNTFCCKYTENAHLYVNAYKSTSLCRWVEKHTFMLTKHLNSNILWETFIL